MGKIIRTFFGPFFGKVNDFQNYRSRTAGVKKFRQVRREMIKSSRNGETCDFVLTCGRQNHELVKSLGFRSILVNRNPIPCSVPWLSRLLMFMIAFDYCDEFVNVDWDTRQKANIPSNFWELMRDGQSFQGPLVTYQINRFKWRKDSEQNKIAPSGCFFYCRDIKHLVRGYAYAMHSSRFIDEVGFARMIDYELGEFSVDRYFQEGYEPPFIHHKRSPFKDNHVSSSCIFTHG